MFGRVLEGFGAAEVNGRFDLGRVAAYGSQLACRANCALRSEFSEGRTKPAADKNLRVNSTGKIAKLFDRDVEIESGLVQKRRRLARIALDPLTHQGKLELEDDQVLLRSIVEIALHAPPSFGGSKNEPRT